MNRDSAWNRAKRLLAALAVAGIPLVTTATCSPRYGTLDIFRYDDYYDFGYFDIFVDDCFFDDCYYFYDEEIIFFD